MKRFAMLAVAALLSLPSAMAEKVTLVGGTMPDDRRTVAHSFIAYFEGKIDLLALERQLFKPEDVSGGFAE